MGTAVVVVFIVAGVWLAQFEAVPVVTRVGALLGAVVGVVVATAFIYLPRGQRER